jgi:hypothetical protein
MTSPAPGCKVRNRARLFYALNLSNWTLYQVFPFPVFGTIEPCAKPGGQGKHIFGKIIENPYIKRRPVKGRFTRERPGENIFSPIAGLSHFLRLITVRNFYRDCGKPLIAPA